MAQLFKNKKGADIPSVIFIILMLFGVAFMFVAMTDISNKIFVAFGSTLNNSADFQDSVAVETLSTIEASNLRVWDYAFLAIALSSLLVLGVTAFSTSISPVFYWVYGILAMLLLALSAMISNMWQSLAVQPSYSDIMVYIWICK